jgi:putative transposase
VVTPSAKREAIGILVQEHRLPITRACQIAQLSRAAYYQEGTDRMARDRPVVEALNGLVARHGRWGFWKCFDRLRLTGHTWNHKRVHRVYCDMRLNLPRRTKKRVPTRTPLPMVAPAAINQIWALDFMHDTLYSGRKFRTLNVIDEANREALAIEIDTSLPSARVIRLLEQLGEMHGLPAAIRCDNGPELTSEALTEWCKQHGIHQAFIDPGKPDQNAFIERFNRSYRNEVLDLYLFESLNEVRDITEEWRVSYNEERPHDSLGKLPPAMYRKRRLSVEKSSFALST